ncbi:MAG: DUF2190 family protein [Micrococcus sp.]|nr:DUF2190 family protein [Micrococcus sp.]
MAKNQRYTHFEHIALTADKDYASGDPVRIGAIAGVAQTAAAAGEKVTVWLDGSYDIPVAGALTEGQTVYINGSGTLTATATGNNPFGVAVVAKGTGTAPSEVAPFGHNPTVAVAAA